MFSWEAWTDELMAEGVSNQSLTPKYVFAQIQCKAPCLNSYCAKKLSLSLEREGRPEDSLCSSNLGFSIRLSGMNSGQWTMYVSYPPGL
jgi:hypothetical protein